MCSVLLLSCVICSGEKVLVLVLCLVFVLRVLR